MCSSDLRHLRQHAALAEQVGIPAERIAVLQNGQVIEFEDGKLRLAEEVPAAMVFVDGSGVGNVSLDVMREREELARDGVVMVQVVLDRYSGGQLQEPELRSQGFLMNGEANGLMAGARQKIADVLLRGNGNVARDLEKELGNYFFGETRRRPVVMVSLVRV